MRDGDELTAAVTGGLLPRHAEVRSQGLRLHCLIWGADDDPTVLLVHGNGGHAHWWDALITAFVPGFRLVAPDLRGHGESDWSTAPSYSIGDFSSDLLAIAEQLAPRRFAIIAHSMGARAAAWFTAQQRDRVRGLALLDTTLAGVDAETAQRWRGRVTGRRDGSTYPSRAAAVDAFRFVPPEDGVTAPIVANLAHHAVCERDGKWTFRFDRGVLSLAGDGAGDLTDLVAGLPCPLWIGRGSNSMVILRREVRILRDKHRDVEVHDFAGAHHFFLSDPASAGVGLRRFLHRLPP
jgi:pimeloyl-ACP methyl ester carboxylesterase